MALLMVRRNQLGNQKDHSFLILSTTDDCKCRNLPASSIKDAIKRGTKIENLGLDSNGNICGTNGSLDRYPLAMYNKIDDIVNDTNNYKLVNNCFVIIGRYKEDNILKVCDGRGCGTSGKDPYPMEGTDEQLVKTAVKNNIKIANASLVDKSFIRSISGNFIELAGKSNVSIVIAKNREQSEAKIKEIREKNEAINKKEQAMREETAKNIKSNKTNIVADKTVKLGGEEYKVDSETVERLQQARERALQRKAYERSRRMSKDNPQYKESDGQSLDKTSPYAIQRLQDRDGVEGLTLEEKVAMSATTLKYIDPFLYAAFMSLKKVYVEKPVGNMKLMGVSDDTLYMVEETVIKLPLPQISFLLMHEMSHIIQMHPIRGRQKKTSQQHYVYNVACDLFINKMIAETYGCRPGVPNIKAMYGENAPVGIEFCQYIDEETGGLVSGLYDESVDVHNTTVEAIYQKLWQENKEKMQQQGNGDNQSSDGESSNGDSSGSNGSNDGSQSGNSGGSSNEQNESGQDGQNSSSGQSTGSSGNGQNGKSGQSNKNESGSSGNNKDTDGKENGNGSSNGQGQNEKDDQNGQGSKSKLTLNGKEITNLPENGQNGTDIVEDEGSDSHGDSEEAQERWARDFLNKIIQKANNMFSEGVSSPMLRMAEENTLRDFVWTNFVKQYLTKISGDEWTYKNPDKKMMNYRLVMKGRTPMETDSEEDVYVCIDVSGSITDADLYKAFEYIRVLLKKLNLTGCVCYWSTIIDGPYPFKNARDLVALRKKGYQTSGGTDANKLFEWIKGRGRRHAPKLVIVLTDGAFAPLKRELKPKSCETLWIITDSSVNYRDFKFTFGKVAPLIPKK